jgi:TonB family protein
MRRFSLVVLTLGLVVLLGPSVAAQAQDPVASARQFSQQGDHMKAIATLKSALSTRPNDAALQAELLTELILARQALETQLRQIERDLATLTAGAPAAAAAARNPAGMPTAPVRVGGPIKTPMKVRDVKPVYPPEAQVARVQGIVILEITLDAQGHVADAKVLRGNPLLDSAAIDAVRQWQYTPVLLNGAPVPVIMTVTVTFSLQ